MSFLKTKNALARFEYRGFEGIDRSDPAGGGAHASYIENYRILSDGSLQKRNGYRYICGFSEPVRAIFSEEIGSERRTYVLAGSTLYSVDPSSGEKSEIGTVGSTDGSASMFFYMSSLYLADGEELYTVEENGIFPVQGYVPLLGNNWGSSYAGEINEPLNRLTPKARISYEVTDEYSIFLSTLYKVKSVDALYLNGVLVDPSQYTVEYRLNAISMGGMSVGDRLLAYVTFERDVDERAELTRNPEASVFGGISDSRVFMWGGEKKERIFCTAFVTEDRVAESEAAYGGSGGLYFPLGNDFTVGDGRYAVSTVSRHLDRLLVFTEGETWMADANSSGRESVPVMRINVENGCLSRYGVAKRGNDPISVGRGRVIRWTVNTDELEDCNAYSISDGIKELLPKSFFKSSAAFEDKRTGEILFSSGDAQDGRVFVYGVDGKGWYIWTDVFAEQFFELDDGIGFLSQNRLYCFDSSLYEDIEESGEVSRIESYYESKLIDFGHPFDKKRLIGAEIRGETGYDGEIEISVTTDRGISDGTVFGGLVGIESRSAGLNCSRFIGVRMRISSDASAPQRIYTVALAVKR